MVLTRGRFREPLFRRGRIALEYRPFAPLCAGNIKEEPVLKFLIFDDADEHVRGAG